MITEIRNSLDRRSHRLRTNEARTGVFVQNAAQRDECGGSEPETRDQGEEVEEL